MKSNDLKRKNKICIALNDKELNLFNKYCEKYGVTNKSQFVRRLLLSTVIEHIVENDYPTLFDDPEKDT